LESIVGSVVSSASAGLNRVSIDHNVIRGSAEDHVPSWFQSTIGHVSAAADGDDGRGMRRSSACTYVAIDGNVGTINIGIGGDRDRSPSDPVVGIGGKEALSTLVENGIGAESGIARSVTIIRSDQDVNIVITGSGDVLQSGGRVRDSVVFGTIDNVAVTKDEVEFEFIISTTSFVRPQSEGNEGASSVGDGGIAGGCRGGDDGTSKYC